MIERVPLTNLTRASFFDPSGGGRSAKSQNAIVIAGMDSTRRIFVLRSWSENCGLGESIHQWQKMNDQFKCWPNYYEGVGVYKAIGDLITEAELHDLCPHCGEKHLKLRAQLIRPEGGGRSAQSKEQRILTYAQKAFEERRVYVRSSMVDIINQVASFGVNEQIDSLDALAYLIHLLKAPLSLEDYMTQKADLELKRQLTTSRIETENNYGGYV